MFSKRAGDLLVEDLVPVPAELPPLDGLDDEDEYAPGRRPRTWLWTLVAAVTVVLMVALILAVGALGFYHGLQDRAVVSAQQAQEHYALGLERLGAGDYELAIAELELAKILDASLPGLPALLQDAKDKAQAQGAPTSEARRDAAALLYTQAAVLYEKGDLEQAVGVLDELYGVDPDYQPENVQAMRVTAHYQLGQDALEGDRLDDAAQHYDAVLALGPDDATKEKAQEQRNLLDLYTAALNHWDRDWALAIQSLKGLLALAPEYKDVRLRLHDAHSSRAQDYADGGDWCLASAEYAAAAEVLPLETTVDNRDDAEILCQSKDEATVAAPTSRAVARATRMPADPSEPTPMPTATPVKVKPALAPVSGQIAFAGYDAARDRYDIYVVDLHQGDAKLLKETASQPAFSPDGKELLFRNLDPVHLGLGILDVEAGELGELTTHAEDSAPAWSADANQVVFASNKFGDRQWRIFAISPGEVRGEGDEWILGRMPAWSDDGSRIAYHGCDERGDACGVWTIRPGGAAPARLSSDASDTAPSWAPDGSKVAFTSARDGNWELYWLDVASGQETRLTDQAAADVSPVWSPDGKQLAFLSNRDGGWALYLMGFESGEMTKVIATGDAYPDPVSERLSWLP
ncbi:hypothetical protein ACFLUM_03200 [Chloroflexota bacterium]